MKNVLANSADKLVFTFWSGSAFDDALSKILGEHRFGFVKYLNNLLWGQKSLFNTLFNNFGVSCKLVDNYENEIQG